MTTIISTSRSWPQRNWLLVAVIAYCLGILTTGIIKSKEPKATHEVSTHSQTEKRSDSSAQKPYEVFGNDNTGINK